MDKLLNHPTALKIISVVLGVLLWAVVHVDPQTSPQRVTSNIDTKIIEAIAIQAEGLDTDKYVLSAMEPTVARLVVEGRISSLFAAGNEDYVVSVDLTDAKPGIDAYPLSVTLPKGIKEIELSPRTVTVRIEEIVTNSFDVGVITEGNPAAGYVMGEPEIMTEGGGAVEITLPRDDMSRVGTAAVTMNVEGADKTVSNKRAKIIVYDKDGNEMPEAIVKPESLHVEVKVTLPFKQVPLQVRYTGTLPENLSLVSVKPELDQVTVFAQREELDRIQVYDGAVLDLSKVKESGVIEVKAPPLDGIQAVAPGEVALQVVVERAINRTLSGIDVDLNGVAEGFRAEIRLPVGGRMDLVVSGAASVLQDLNASEVRIAANVDGLDAGIHKVPLEIDLPPYVQPVLDGGQPLTATIEIIDESLETSEGTEDVEVGANPTDSPDRSEDDGGQPQAGEDAEGDQPRTTAADSSGSTADAGSKDALPSDNGDDDEGRSKSDSNSSSGGNKEKFGGSVQNNRTTVTV
ncbi:CdaR family protein [Paenibacillus sp. J5C_2022]|uniref:CdaR family protein n=1 Tax=Paenibacillus sp. J5C2022 TaxID=2977129 RepID=UPI0021D0460D|nr:CdaR family protein [Paenibacillus sp. J5C2022]MCU6709757.1 CdaR family protein [Paenibacillus sp. J5C2022]